MVDMDICLRVAEQEQNGYKEAMEGIYGMERQVLAQEEGLGNICYARWEKGRKVFRCDLLTGETFVEPKRLEYEELERLAVLRNIKQFQGSMNPNNERELTGLEQRAKLHRQEIK